MSTITCISHRLYVKMQWSAESAAHTPTCTADLLLLEKNGRHGCAIFVDTPIQNEPGRLITRLQSLARFYTQLHASHESHPSNTRYSAHGNASTSSTVKLSSLPVCQFRGRVVRVCFVLFFLFSLLIFCLCLFFLFVGLFRLLLLLIFFSRAEGYQRVLRIFIRGFCFFLSFF